MITPSRKARKIHLTKSEWVVFGVIFVYSFIPAFGGLIRVLELAGGPQIAPANPRALLAPTPILLHILSSFLFCIVGAAQFLPSIRRQRPAAHRVIGRMIAVAGCMSALTGLWMTHFYVFPAALQGGRAVLGASGSGHGNDRPHHLGRDRNQIPQRFPARRVDGPGLCHRPGCVDAGRFGYCLDHRCWLRSDGNLARRADDICVGGQSAWRRNLHTRKIEATKASARSFITASYSTFNIKKRDLK